MRKKESFLFENNSIHRVWHNNKWWFSIEDIVSTFIESSNSRDHINKIRQNDKEFDKSYIKLTRILENNEETPPWKMNCTNLEGIFRLIQSINTPKAEPFKLWLAKLGKQRIDELSNNT